MASNKELIERARNGDGPWMPQEAHDLIGQLCAALEQAEVKRDEDGEAREEARQHWAALGAMIRRAEQAESERDHLRVRVEALAIELNRHEHARHESERSMRTENRRLRAERDDLRAKLERAEARVTALEDGSLQRVAWGALAEVGKKLRATETERDEMRAKLEQAEAERDLAERERAATVGMLKQANSNFEEFERRFYLEQDRAELAEALLPTAEEREALERMWRQYPMKAARAYLDRLLREAP